MSNEEFRRFTIYASKNERKNAFLGSLLIRILICNDDTILIGLYGTNRPGNNGKFPVPP